MEPQVEELTDVAPNIGAAYEITVFDKDGKVKQVISEDAKCYVQNFLRMLRFWYTTGGDNGYVSGGGGNAVLAPFRNLTGAIVQSGGYYPASSIGLNYGSFLGDALLGDLTKGIVTGTGVVAVTADDYCMGTLIAHGSAVGQMIYDASSFLPLNIVGSTITVTISRMVTNSTASAITFTEIGLYLKGMISIMVLRDIVSPSVSLNPGESALIAYRLIVNG